LYDYSSYIAITGHAYQGCPWFSIYENLLSSDFRLYNLKLKIGAGVINLRGRMREFLGPKDF